MVGGEVTHVDRWGETVGLIVKDDNESARISLQRNGNSLTIKPGDWVWWQSGNAYWTPLCRTLEDVEIVMIGRATSV